MTLSLYRSNTGADSSNADRTEGTPAAQTSSVLLAVPLKMTPHIRDRTCHLEVNVFHSPGRIWVLMMRLQMTSRIPNRICPP